MAYGFAVSNMNLAVIETRCAEDIPTETSYSIRGRVSDPQLVTSATQDSV